MPPLRPVEKKRGGNGANPADEARSRVFDVNSYQPGEEPEVCIFRRRRDLSLLLSEALLVLFLLLLGWRPAETPLSRRVVVARNNNKRKPGSTRAQ